MYDTEEMVNLLKRRPGMYIGTKNTNTEELYIFLKGFYVGKSACEMTTELDITFYRNFSRYVYDWLEKNNKLNNEQFSFEWYRLLDSFEEGISLFHLISEKFFSEYHSDNLEKRYYFNDTNET